MRTHLSKRDIEELLDAYDADPVDAVTVALRKIVESADPTWGCLVASVPESVAAQSGLRNHDIDALDAVVKHLVENRCLQK